MRCGNMEGNTFQADERVAALEGRVGNHTNLLNDQIDRRLRKQLSIHNIPMAKAKEYWDETNSG